MARVKSVPLRREPSSEYTSRDDAAGSSPRSSGTVKGASSINSTELNGQHNGKMGAGIDLPVVKDVGLPQLLMAVGGIYGSL